MSNYLELSCICNLWCSGVRSNISVTMFRLEVVTNLYSRFQLLQKKQLISLPSIFNRVLFIMYLTSELNAGDNPLVDSYSLQGWGGGEILLITLWYGHWG